MDVVDVVKSIGAGELDDELGKIRDAIKERAQLGAARFAWRIKFDNLEITEENQSIAEAMSVERQTRKPWGLYHPASSAVEASAIIVAALIEREGATAEAAFARLKHYSATEIAAGVDEYQMVDPPKDGSAPAT